MKNVCYLLLAVVVTFSISCDKEESITHHEGDNLKFTFGKGISKVIFKAKHNRTLKSDVEAYIDPNKKVIAAIVPEGTDITSLIPSIEPSTAQFSPTGPQDFRNPVKYEFNVNGRIERYVIKVQVGYTDRDVLIAIHRANPGNTLGWADNLDDPDLSHWEGVIINDNSDITTLIIASKGLTNLPPEIGQLTNLNAMTLINNRLEALPSEMGQLTNLTDLFLSANMLKSLPPEMGQLINLSTLGISGNLLESMPKEIGQLTNLAVLGLNHNRLESLPPEMGQLTNLQRLYLKSNNITVLDGSICDLELQGSTDIDIVPGVQCQY